MTHWAHAFTNVPRVQLRTEPTSIRIDSENWNRPATKHQPSACGAVSAVGATQLPVSSSER
jgi:hypothetical protein